MKLAKYDCNAILLNDSNSEFRNENGILVSFNTFSRVRSDTFCLVVLPLI